MDELSGKVLMFNSEACGADPDLGFEILMRLFETLPKRQDRPAAIVFWNTAVKLLAAGSPLLPHLRRLQEQGVDLLAGRLCATEFCIADNITVGRVATMDEILDVILHHEVINL